MEDFIMVNKMRCSVSNGKEKKNFLKKLWCFFFGCNCH